MRPRPWIALFVLGACTAEADDIPPDAQPFLPDAAPVPCEQELDCPAPESDKLTVCGRLYDVESGSPVSGFLHADFYDALAYANDPAIPRLTFEMYRYDACGRFIVTGLSPTDSGFLAISVDDSPQGFDGDHADTAVAIAAQVGNAYGGIRAYSLASWTEATWSNQIGVTTSGLVEAGASLVIHTQDGAPIEGFPIDIGTGTPQASYGFSDSSSFSHTTLLPGAETTGVNGTELRLEIDNTVPTEWSCNFLVQPIPGVFWVTFDEQSCYL